MFTVNDKAVAELENPVKCQGADSCTNTALWIVYGRAVKPHLCCDHCKNWWIERSRMDVTIEVLGKVVVYGTGAGPVVSQRPARSRRGVQNRNRDGTTAVRRT